MRLISLYVQEFKNLRETYIRFDEDSPYTVLVGENGAGKSNLIEAITLIFRNLDLGEHSPFAYQLEYQCRGSTVTVDASKGAWPRIHVRENESAKPVRLSKAKFLAEDSDGRPFYRPAFVFGYYSGPSDRLAELFEKHSERFYNWIIQPKRPRADSALNDFDPNSLRRLFYARTLHGQFALLSFFMSSSAEADEDRAFLRDRLQIDGLDSVLFALRRPEWRRPGKTGDSRFWGAEGEVRNFLDRVYRVALLPMRMDRRISVNFAKSPLVENLYLFLPDAQSLKDVYAVYDDQYRFFTALESTHLSNLLAEVRTRVRMTPEGGGTEITYRDLSEGEQQLLLVLGLLKFTARDEALFLLDEPDTHLNPAWSTQYLEFLDRFIRIRERRGSCHIVMTTHDPLVFAGLRRSQVRILRRAANGQAIVEAPDQDPRGMGVNAILTSDLFRLTTTLDRETQNDLDRQRELATTERTEAEDRELLELNLHLRELGFAQTARDPLYELFRREWTNQEDPAWRETVELTPEQLVQRADLAERIVRELRAERQES